MSKNMARQEYGMSKNIGTGAQWAPLQVRKGRKETTVLRNNIFAKEKINHF